ncbi:hypothetical protein ACIBI9_49385 [Nonomuraea sp. NPDC050451]|uniref:hypothetical protein n=1 Tax=Nonomuraea sp. NPDC050451 TaxID=3364364 RepID=UPI0037B3B3F1
MSEFERYREHADAAAGLLGAAQEVRATQVSSPLDIGTAERIHRQLVAEAQVHAALAQAAAMALSSGADGSR